MRLSSHTGTASSSRPAVHHWEFQELRHAAVASAAGFPLAKPAHHQHPLPLHKAHVTTRLRTLLSHPALAWVSPTVIDVHRACPQMRAALKALIVKGELLEVAVCASVFAALLVCAASDVQSLTQFAGMHGLHLAFGNSSLVRGCVEACAACIRHHECRWSSMLFCAASTLFPLHCWRPMCRRLLLCCTLVVIPSTTTGLPDNNKLPILHT